MEINKEKNHSAFTAAKIRGFFILPVPNIPFPWVTSQQAGPNTFFTDFAEFNRQNLYSLKIFKPFLLSNIEKGKPAIWIPDRILTQLLAEIMSRKNYYCDRMWNNIWYVK